MFKINVLLSLKTQKKMIKYKKELIKNKITELALVSTSHGLPSVFRVERNFLKITWLFLFIGGCVISILLVKQSIIDYLNYSVVTNINEIYEMPIEYPKISFINSKYPKLNLPLEKKIVRCTFNIINCNSSDFEIIRDDLGFISYEFKKTEAVFTGGIYGFQLMVDFGNLTQYENKETGLNGMRFVIHNKKLISGLNGGMSDRGVDVEFGQSADITIKRIDSQKLDKPFSDCIKDVTSIDSFDSSLYKYILNSTNYSYTQEYCLDLCRGRETNKYFNISNKIDSSLNAYLKISYLNIPSKDLDFFLTNVLIKITKEICFKECPLECDSVKYQYSYSSKNFDLQKRLAYFKSNKISIDPSYEKSNYFENVFTVRIYYDQTSYTRITEIPKTELIDLIASIGGNLGLFIGISFLSFAELFELIIEIIVILFHKNNNTVEILNNQELKI
jgi:hypothetical protein